MNNRKRKVLESSMQLFIEKGIQNTSIQDIINHAGISKGTFYNYFNSKNECLLAILEQTRYEASLRRNEVLVGRNENDVDVLTEQIAILMYVNQEKNIFSLFEAVFRAQDRELKKIIAQNRIYEIGWLSGRFVDVYGEEIRPYAFECAVLFYGMLHHLMMAWGDAHSMSYDPLKMAKSVVQNIEVIIKDKVKRKEIIIDDGTVQILQQKIQKHKVTFETVSTQLSGFIEGINVSNADRNEKGEQFSNYLLEELTREQPRFYVLENNLKAFHESFIDTPHLAEAKEIASRIWYLIKAQYSPKK